jgi:Glu-tRNA(Gln) amidotransferase subunit E-like FAD-binding protein
MYPDTDTPPIPVADALVERIRVSLPETPWARVEHYRSLGLTPATADVLAGAPWASLFDRAAPPAGEVARRLAASLAKRIPYHRRAGRRIPDGAGSVLQHAMARIAAGDVRPEALDRIVDAVVTRPGTPPAEIIAPFAPPPPDVERLIADTASRARAMNGRSADTLLRWAMGEVMPGAIGQVDPRDVRRRLTDRLSMIGAEAAP